MGLKSLYFIFFLHFAFANCDSGFEKAKLVEQMTKKPGKIRFDKRSKELWVRSIEAPSFITSSALPMLVMVT